MKDLLQLRSIKLKNKQNRIIIKTHIFNERPLIKNDKVYLESNWLKYDISLGAGGTYGTIAAHDPNGISLKDLIGMTSSPEKETKEFLMELLDVNLIIIEQLDKEPEFIK